MAIYAKTTLLFLIFIVSPNYLESLTWRFNRNQCCQTYPATTPAPKCTPCSPPPPKPTPAPVKTCCGLAVAKPCKPCAPVYPTTTAAPKMTPSPCLPPTCYTDKAKQKAELEKIYKESSQMMVDYSDAATGPVVYVAQTISSGAELIPTLFSAGGNFLGKAIAAPIQFFNRLGFSLLTGAISQVVTIPISFSTSVRASTVLLQPYLNWFGLGGKDALNTCCPPPPSALGSAFEQIGLRPIGILTGPAHLALGSIMKIGGTTFRLIGTLTKSGGELVENSGLGLKNIGALKVADGISSVADFLSKVDSNSGTQTICVDDGQKLAFYEETKYPVEPAKTVVPYAKTTVAPYTKPTIKPVTTPYTTPYTTSYTTTPYTTSYTTPYTTPYTTLKPYTTLPPKTYSPTTVKYTTPSYTTLPSTTVKVVVADKKPEPVFDYTSPLPKLLDEPYDSNESIEDDEDR